MTWRETLQGLKEELTNVRAMRQSRVDKEAADLEKERGCLGGQPVPGHLQGRREVDQAGAEQQDRVQPRLGTNGHRFSVSRDHP